MAVYLDAVGVCAPGLEDWSQALAVLQGGQAYDAGARLSPRTSLLAANERRRTTAVIRLALQTAEDALRRAQTPASALCSVFASSSGDMEIVDKICSALSLPERPVSPTQFHNSVHNAPAGYWSLGVAAQSPSTSIAAHDGSFAAGLLEAWSTVEVERQGVLLVAYDWPPPVTLQPHRPLAAPFAVAMVLLPEPGPSSPARLELAFAAGDITTLAHGELESLRRGNPAAQCLPLLDLIARGRSGVVSLPGNAYDPLQVRCQTT